MRIYLDVCCLNRPFDDPSQPRVAMEAAAIAHIIELIEAGRLTDYSSEIAEVEVERNPDADRRRKVSALLPPAARIIPLSDALLDEADQLMARGFALADAVHLASARSLRVDVFVTVDDRLLKRAATNAKAIGIRVTDPLSFLEEFEHASDR